MELHPNLWASTVSGTTASGLSLHASTVSHSRIRPAEFDPVVILKEDEPARVGGRKILIDPNPIPKPKDRR